MEATEMISHNRDLQRQARALNIRVGESIFPVMSREGIERWLAERLNGARRLSEVEGLDVLMFPALDSGLVEIVMGKNPDEITVLGQTLRVEYRDGYAPRVTLDRETIAAHGWRELPDAGITLPGGRLVEVVVPFSGYRDDIISGQDIPELKARCVSKANKSLWENWPQEGRPAIALPDPADPASIVPEIIECQYGTSVVDGASLIAFGTMVPKSYRYSSSDPWFESRWFRVREEAEAAHAKSAAKLEEIRKEAIEQKRLHDAKKAAEAAKESLRNIRSREGWDDLESGLRRRVDDRYYAYLPSGLEDLQSWARETEELFAEADAALTVLARRKAERVAAFGPLLAMDGVNDDEALAERIDAFVRDCIEIRGARKTAEILRQEAEANYGRARRTDAIADEFRDVDHRGLEWKSGCDIWPAAEWAEHLAKEEAPSKTKSPSAPAPKEAPTTPPVATASEVTVADLQARFGGGRPQKQQQRRRR